VKRLYIYAGAYIVIGGSMGGPAMRSLITGEWSLPVLLLTIGGCGMVLGAVYELLRTDPDEFSISASRLFVVVGAGCLCFLGTLLSVISGT
jgi:hypothetical protein